MGCGASSTSSIDDKQNGQQGNNHENNEKDKTESHNDNEAIAYEKKVEDSEVIQNVDRAVDELKELQEQDKKKSELEHHESSKHDKKKKHKKDDSSDRDSDNEEEERVGTLFLVIGPSGSGKDSLVKGARSVIGDHEDYHFAKLYMTRSEESETEDHVTVPREDYDKMVENKEFCLHWQAHGHGYGISKKIKAELKANKNVIAIASRTLIEHAQKKLKKHNVVVVEVNAHPDIVRERLTKRGRESQEEIEERIHRNSRMADMVKQTAKNLKVVWNNSSVDEGVDKFLAAVQYLPEDMLEEEEPANDDKKEEEEEEVLDEENREEESEEQQLEPQEELAEEEETVGDEDNNQVNPEETEDGAGGDGNEEQEEE